MANFNAYRLVKRRRGSYCEMCRQPIDRGSIRVTGRCNDAGWGILTCWMCSGCIENQLAMARVKAERTKLPGHVREVEKLEAVLALWAAWMSELSEAAKSR